MTILCSKWYQPASNYLQLSYMSSTLRKFQLSCLDSALSNSHWKWEHNSSTGTLIGYILYQAYTVWANPESVTSQKGVTLNPSSYFAFPGAPSHHGQGDPALHQWPSNGALLHLEEPVASSGGQFNKKAQLATSELPWKAQSSSISQGGNTVSVPSRLKTAFVNAPPKSSELMPFNQQSSRK